MVVALCDYCCDVNDLFFFFLCCRVPLTIVNKAHQANQIYPYAISLIESVRTYERTLEKVSKHCFLMFV